MLTLDFGFKMRVLVDHLHLLLPVKLVPPIGHHFSKIGRVKSIMKAAILKWVCVSCLINALVQILWIYMERKSFRSSMHQSSSPSQHCPTFYTFFTLNYL